MEIWQYIEVLRRPNKTWFLGKDYTEEKINALAKIAIDGHSGLIYSLIEFLKDNNKEIREATCKTIIYLFRKVESKNCYYDTLKHCSISKSDIDYYEITFPTEQYIELLAICSLNGNGYIREKAIKKLAQVKNPRAIQFIIYRLADWVLPVRQAALEGIESYKSTTYIDSLIENLLVFEWLQKVQRIDLSGIYQEIIGFITFTNRNYVITNFKKYPDKLRLLIAKHISVSLTDYTKELELFLTDQYFLIRRLAIDHFDKLEKDEIDQLLRDRSANIRLQTLYCLKNQNGFDIIVKNYLADNSAAIRSFARYHLEHANIDFADFYNQNLQERNQIVGSLSGLSEIDAKPYSEIVKGYLNDKKINVKKIAFLALCKLDEESAYEFAFTNLDTLYTGLRNLIINFLALIPRQEVLIRAREIYKTGNYDLRKSMLKFFNKIGGWTIIPDIMIGSIDKNENIRLLAFDYLQIWRTRAVRLFSVPKPEEIDRAKQIFSFVYETHEYKRYFEANPLDGLNFYFE